MAYDFGGYATRNDMRCSDGRIIRHNAFKECDGQTVPLVWQHTHDSPENVIGHADLENRDDGVYAYGTFNSTPNGQIARDLVQHGDISALSIYANRLQQQGPDVTHGIIREVSLVLAGANPGAFIDNIGFAHGDDECTEEAVIFNDVEGLDLAHEDEAEDEEDASTVEEVLDTLTDEQQDAVYAALGMILAGDDDIDDDDMEHADSDEPTIGEILSTLNEEQRAAVSMLFEAALEESEFDDEDEDEDDDIEHSYYEEEDEMTIKHNLFEGEANYDGDVLTHADMEEIIADAKIVGSMREAALQHGITGIDVLFPDAQLVTNPPAMISRRMEWVSGVLSGVHKSPFSRIKSTAANITADEARARGYIKGNKKIEEQIAVLKRVTTPQTVYKLQKLDRDDIIDITDFDVVAWLKQEMRMMLDEELARAILVGDGRLASSQDKINENNIRPIWSDDDMYAVHTEVDVDGMSKVERAQAFIDACIKARKAYKGSGSPTMFIGADQLTELRLLRNSIGERLFKNDQELADELRVSRIVEIELFDGLTRTVDGDTKELGAIIVNLGDYTVGADKGGEVSLFDDFDLNYNKYEYLIETRCCGALTQPASALVIEFPVAAENDGE